MRSGTHCVRLVSLIAAALLVGCTARLSQRFESPPLFPTIDARVGASYGKPLRQMVHVVPGLNITIEVGQPSVERFKQVFGAMFSTVVELPDWPPWQEDMSGLAGVIELDGIEMDVTLGNDLNKPDRVAITYHVCLYESADTPVNCWTAHAANDYQRGLYECFDLRNCLTPQTEAAIRAAIARFMLDFEADPKVKAWVARVTSGKQG